MHKHLSRAALLATAATAIAAGPAQAAYTSSIAGSTVTMTGDAAADTIVLDQSAGLLRHNRFPGDPGFNSAFDFSSSVAGDQTVSAASNATTVKVNAGDGADILTVGSASAPGTAISTPFEFDGGNQVDTFNLEASADTTARDFAWSATGQTLVVGTGSWFHPGVEVASARLGSGADMVRVASTDNNGTAALDSGPGDDSFLFGQSGTTLGTVVGPITVDAGAGTDSLLFGDSAQTGRHGYRIDSTTFNRDELGVMTFANAESGRLDSSSGVDNVYKRGSLPFTFNEGVGADNISSVDSVADTINCGDGNDVVFADLFDVVAADCESVSKTDTTPPLPPPVPDTKPPVLTVHVPKTVTKKKLLKGLYVTVRSNEASTVAVEERAAAKGQVRLAANYNLTLASASLPIASVPGFRALKLKANRTLVGRAKRFSVRFYITAVDAAGNRAQTMRTVKVRP
jgi:hypothetical protein